VEDVSMKRFLLALAMLLGVVAPVRNAAADPLVRAAVIACAFGAGTLGTATYARLVPALVTGVLVPPLAEVIVINALIGCGIGVAGVVSATLMGRAYDSF
jgi:hypothetical protein